MSDCHSMLIKLDVKKAFFTGIAGAATYGGLTLYMSTLGNLGGYILVTKAVSLLSAMGIGVGGTAAAVAAVSAIGGPITLVIGLSIAASLVAMSISGIGWKKSLAKRTIKSFEKEDVSSKYLDELNKFWDETEHAFRLGMDHVIDSLDDVIEKEEASLKIDDEGYDEILSELNRYKGIFETLPIVFSK